jgi:hypothetical protein
MKHLLKSVSASNSRVIAHLKMGSDTFNIVDRDNRTYGVYDGCDVLNCVNFRESTEKIAHILKDFIEEYSKSNKCASLSVFKSKDTGDTEGFFEQLKDIPGVKKVTIKVLPEDMTEIGKTLRPEFDVSSVADRPALVNGLREFSQLVSDMCKTLNVCRDDALTLTQGKLINSMWGAGSMQQILNDLNRDIAENGVWERVEFFATLIIKSVERLIHKLSTDLSTVCAEEKKMIGTVLIPNVLTNYEQFRKIMSSALLSLSSLIYIDAVFKKATSYPATWFMNGSMLEDLKQDYRKILGFMVRIPEIEQTVIYPLDFMKLQYLG